MTSLSIQHERRSIRLMIAALSLISVGVAACPTSWPVALFSPDGHIAEVIYLYGLRAVAAVAAVIGLVTVIMMRSDTLSIISMALCAVFASRFSLEATLRATDWFVKGGKTQLQRETESRSYSFGTHSDADVKLKLTDVFDAGQQDFIDYCHLREAGAECLAEVLVPYVRDAIAHRTVADSKMAVETPKPRDVGRRRGDGKRAG